jgi:outer membrane protein assembly factor BamB
MRLAVTAGMTLKWLLRPKTTLGISSRIARRAFGLVAITLGALFFTRINYVLPQSGTYRAIVSLDRQFGDIKWMLRELSGPQVPFDGRNSPATPTPVTDGRYVCGYFGTAGLMCADVDGRLAWTRIDFPYDSMYGVAASPLLVDGMLLVARDMPDGFAVVEALALESGASVWTQRFPTTSHSVTGNSRTPIVSEFDGENILVLWGMTYVKGVSVRTGEPVWTYQYTSSRDLVASAVSDSDRLYLAAVEGTVALDKADLAAGRDPVRWRSKAGANCVSPVLANGFLFTVTDSGIGTAMRADTGEIVWRHRFVGQYFASLVASRDEVYFTNNEGLTTVVAAGAPFPIVGANDLRDETLASMAAAGGDLYIRSTSHVYAVEAK